jgi:hypothetical protein
MRVFFSYSHDSEEHKAWVQTAARDLASRGVETILDQDDLKPGYDILQFAEAAVESSNFVLMVCTPNYARKANGRTHGVGWEVSVITSELYAGATGKFIALLRQGTPEQSIPNFMKTKLWIDVRNDEDSSSWNSLCEHILNNGDVSQIGNLIYEALFEYDEDHIYDQPRLPELKRFTQFIETGQTEEGRWYVVRKDPIKGDLATILFQDPIGTS